MNIPEVVREMFEEGTIRQAGQWRARLGWRGIVDHANPMGAENLSLRDARRALDLDYYGQKDAKSRILELLAVGTLQGSMRGKIIHLVGPSGMGRKRTGKSMADAFGRRFFRFSIGGLRTWRRSRIIDGHMLGKVLVRPWLRSLTICRVL